MAKETAPIEVTVEINGRELMAGTLWTHERQRRSATFRYHDTYLADPAAYSLDPALPLGSGVVQTTAGREMFSAFGDSAPDRWGQNLMRLQERERATTAGAVPRRLGQADFLLGTHDDLRQGAVRFRDPSIGTYWSPGP